MTDQYDFSPAGADPGQGSQNVPEGGQPAEGKPDYVTRADLEAFKTAIVEEARRAAQSLTDRQESRVEKRLREWQDQMKRDGVSVTPQMVERGREQLALAELTGAAKGGAAKPQPDANDPPELVALKQYVTRRADKLMQSIGVTLEQDDPEFSEVKFVTDDPDEYLESLEAAAKKKAERLQRAPGARSPMAVQGAAGGNAVEQFKADVRAVRGKGAHAYNQVLQRWRERGVDVDNIKVF